jgi:hypothetical protein
VGRLPSGKAPRDALGVNLPHPPGAHRAAAAWGGAAVVIASISVATMLAQGWVPIDEGTLSLSARYVNAGFLPHRDFAYPYTGGLAFIGAFAMRLAGDTMMAARWMMLAAMVPWLCCVWLMTRRWCGPVASAAAVLLAAWWSVLMYPAAMPTWYLLFLSTATLLALFRWADGGGTRWLLLAGIACGLAIAIKQTGLFTFVGAGFGVLVLMQDRGRRAFAADGKGSRTARANPVVLLALGIAMVVPAFLVLRRGVLSGEMLTLALPLASVIAALIVREVRCGSGAPGALFRAWGLLLAGALVPPALLILIYAAGGGLGALATGLGAGTIRTASYIESVMPSAPSIVARACVILLPAALLSWIKPGRWVTVLAIAAAIGTGLYAMQVEAGYRQVWYFAVLLAPAAVVTVCVLAIRRDDGGAGHAGLLVCATALCLHALNQFPYSAPNYFGYVAPLAVILIAALSAALGATRRLVYVAALLLAFGGWFHRIGSVGTVGLGPVWWDTAHRLASPHGGLLVTAPDSSSYARLTELTHLHGGADSLVAGPEMPALYALAGTKRLVAQPYLIVADALADSATMAATFNFAATRAVAIHRAPIFLPQISTEADAWLARRFPFVERVGDVDFRWR